MEFRSLGQSELQVSVIGFGGWGIAGGSMWGEQEDKDSIAALEAALDAGITFFDTAEGYGGGYSEEVIGKALSRKRSACTLATKVSPGNLGADALRASCEASLKRLRTDYIDLYQIHWPTPPGDPGTVVETLAELRQEGKIRYAGVSNFGPSDLAPYPSDLFVSNQLSYSLAFRAIEYELVSASIARGMSVITYSSLLHGILTGKFKGPDEVPPGRARTRHFSSERSGTRHDEPGQEAALFELVGELERIADEIDMTAGEVAMLWVVAQPGVATTLAGCRTREHAERNAATGAKALPEAIVERLTAKSNALKQALGPNPDMWMTDSRVSWQTA